MITQAGNTEKMANNANLTVRYAHTHTHTTKHLTLSFPKFSSRRSQSALEYMMTYGWAILIIVIVAVILYSVGIFNPSSSISSTVTGFSGFSVQAICAPGGVLMISLGNELGKFINITSVNSTIGTASTHTAESLLLAPDQTGKVVVLGGCINASNTRYSSSLMIKYSEPGSTLPGPYVSLGKVSGTSTSFIQNTVANFSNSSSMSSPHSISFNRVWNSGSHYTLIGWFNVKAIWHGDSMLLTEIPGCNSGMSSNPGTTSYFGVSQDEWYGGADTCTNTGDLHITSGNIVPFNTWVMLTGIFDWNGSGGWQAICVDSDCINQTFSSSQLPGGPANYSNPNPYITYFAASWIKLNAKVANIQVYDSSFSQAQVTAEYGLGLGGVPVNPNNLVAWFPLDGNFNDYSGNSNTVSESNVNFVSP